VKYVKTFNGYMAVTSAIIITVVMTLVGLSISFSSLFGRSNALADNYRQQAFASASACLDYALLQRSLSSGYAGNEVVNVPIGGGSTLSCSISPITTQGLNIVIRSTATVGGSRVNLELVAVSSSLTRVSLSELPTI
jgi:hypothetical protein